jgi:uncharacterized protein involved in outer membrane biogenesis
MASNDLKKNEPPFWKAFPARAASIARSPQWQRRLAWALGGWLLLWALAWLAVPPLLKSQLEKIASDKLGRRVTVGAVDFKPWSLELTLSELAVARSGAAPGAPALPQLSIKRIYIDAELASLLRLAPVADALEVDEAALSLTHLGQGRYDIDDILARLKASADKAPGAALRFALYNLVLSGGRLDFTDQPLHKTHALRDLRLSLPFLSNLAARREVRTALHLAFRLNGTSFDTDAAGTPFAQTRQTDASIRFSGLDLGPYLGYWPASLPWRLQGAVLDADARVAFEQTPAPVVRVSGTLTADKVRLQGVQGGAPAAGRDLLAFERLHIVMDEVRPLEQFVKLSAVVLTAPTLQLTRDRTGRLNLLPAAPPVATKNIAGGAGPERAGGQNDAQSPAVSRAPWTVQVASMAVRDGGLNWLDESLPSPARIRLTGITLDAASLALPFAAASPVQFRGALGLDPASASAAASPALVRFSGTATDQAASLTATAADWPLSLAAKYVGQFLLPALNGRLDAELGVNWQAAGAGRAQLLQISAPQLRVSDMALAQGKSSLVSVKRVALADMAIDVTGQSLRAASMQLTEPRARVERGRDRRWMFEHWLPARAKAPAPPLPKSGAGAGAPSWSVAIDAVQLEGGALSFSDKAGARPVSLEISAANARLGALLLGARAAQAQKGKKGQGSPVMPLSASLKLGTGARGLAPGKLAFDGSLGLSPVQARGQLLVERLPLQAFEPYFADALNIDLLRADASFKGRVAYRQMPAGALAQLSGEATLEEFRANTLAPSEELLAWKALKLRGLQVALAPAQATRVDVKESVLTDFFARVIVTPEGRINLQDLLKPAGAAAAAADRSATASAVPTGPAPIVNVGPLSLINGKVLFSDRFVKPNYSANLSELSGKLGAFSSVEPAMADLELRGKAEGTASLEIVGKLNPLARPLALEIQGKVRDLELPPLSPYSVKYAGYGIQRGKLSVDVSYRVLPDGQLTASNKLILHQLSFGDKVEGATASLPVKLAVALLADRNGVIDINLPVSGSLNDPQFSLGSVIVKLIVNLVVKAISAPFSLLAAAFSGGGEELGTVSFAAGTALLAPEARAGLDKVAQALADRPALQLTVVGASSLDAERDGFKRERLAEMLRSEKRRAGVAEGGTATAAISVSPAEYPALLKQVYGRADLPKPRNLIGLAKDLPVPEMEKLLLAGIAVDDAAMRELAVQRAVAVRDYLAAGGVPLARLFVGAPKSVPPDAQWTPRAELELALP